jgi:mannitol/fructose-specific phosphotransferase system IIA component (Ntr-type)/phosphotransferase system HPr-like phosphotransfer protein
MTFLNLIWPKECDHKWHRYSAVSMLKSSSRWEALRFMLRDSSVSDGIDDGALLEEIILEAQARRTFSIGNGVAVPHALVQSSVCHATITHLVIFEEPVDWGALDGIKVRIALLVVSPIPYGTLFHEAIADACSFLREHSDAILLNDLSSYGNAVKSVLQIEEKAKGDLVGEVLSVVDDDTDGFECIRIRIAYALGIHARPACLIVQASYLIFGGSSGNSWSIRLRGAASFLADPYSIMQVMMMGGSYNEVIAFEYRNHGKSQVIEFLKLIDCRPTDRKDVDWDCYFFME